VLGALDVLEQHGELVATEPGGGVGRTERREQPLADLAETSSPTGCPRLSLIVLKSSRSMNMTPIGVRSSERRDSACATRSAKRARFASPVTESWNAWWASCRSNALRSLMSREFRTTPRMCSSSIRLECRISNSSSVPSRCTSVHSSVWLSFSSPDGSRMWPMRPRSAGATSVRNVVPCNSSAP
jgi:hypothetical protein